MRTVAVFATNWRIIHNIQCFLFCIHDERLSTKLECYRKLMFSEVFLVYFLWLNLSLSLFWYIHAVDRHNIRRMKKQKNKKTKKKPAAGSDITNPKIRYGIICSDIYYVVLSSMIVYVMSKLSFEEREKIFLFFFCLSHSCWGRKYRIRNQIAWKHGPQFGVRNFLI